MTHVDDIIKGIADGMTLAATKFDYNQQLMDEFFKKWLKDYQESINNSPFIKDFRINSYRVTKEKVYLDVSYLMPPMTVEMKIIPTLKDPDKED